MRKLQIYMSKNRMIDKIKYPNHLPGYKKRDRIKMVKKMYNAHQKYENAPRANR